MSKPFGAFVLGLIALSSTVLAQPIPELHPYALPADAENALTALAAETDVLILGETHGTQEVPAVAAALVEPLSKLGYGVLALEIPTDVQQPLIDWATGKATDVPHFFVKPAAEEDGRASIQLLGLIRTAVAPPYAWKLCCIDASEAEVKREYEELMARQKAGNDETPKAKSGSAAIPDWQIAFWQRRDAGMAEKLATHRQGGAEGAKVLTICGGFHARTSNECRADSPNRISPDNPMSKFWPSFAASLRKNNPTWHVRSINVEAHSGDYFAVVGTANGPSQPKPTIHRIRSNQKLTEAVARPLESDYYDWMLSLPRATAATFLSIPNPPRTLEAESLKEVKEDTKKDSALRQELLRRVNRDQDAREAWIKWTKEHGEKLIGKVNSRDFTDGQKAEFEQQFALVAKIDEENSSWLKEIVESEGWPTVSLVGKDGANAAWLLVQHSDRDPAFQRKCLDLMSALPKNEASQKDIANLTDRVLLKEGKKQRYGTQFINEDGVWKPQPLDDEAHVDARRAEIGLDTLAEYVEQLKAIYGDAHKAK
jgi:hypothetical protein